MIHPEKNVGDQNFQKNYFSLTDNYCSHWFSQDKNSTANIAESIIRKWSSEWTSQEKKRIHTFLMSSPEIYFFLGPFLERIRQNEYIKNENNISQKNINGKNKSIKNPQFLKETVLTSGAIAFYGAILLSIVEKQTVEDLENIYHFVCLYMILDFFLDDPSVSPNEKRSIMDKLSKIMKNPENLSFNQDDSTSNEISHQLIYHFQKILISRPDSFPYLKAAYQSEVEAAKYQMTNPESSFHNIQSEKLNPMKYLYLAEWKGGTTIQAIQSIIGIPSDSAGYHLGACIQLVDDIHDIQEDISEKIITEATIFYEKDGNLDELLFYTLHTIDKLPGKYTIFKPILVGLTMHSLAIIPFFSSSLKEKFSQYSPFRKEANLRQEFHQVLLQYFRGNHHFQNM